MYMTSQPLTSKGALMPPVGPVLWDAICLLTKPIKEEAKPNPIRWIRRFYCLCVVLFCTNSCCSFPIHTVLTDIIECCGGSQRLIKLLNRLGVSASSETHWRYMQYQIERLFENGPMTKYPTNTLTLFSIDNLDLSTALLECTVETRLQVGMAQQYKQHNHSQTGP